MCSAAKEIGLGSTVCRTLIPVSAQPLRARWAGHCQRTPGCRPHWGSRRAALACEKRKQLPCQLLLRAE
eukprot:847499-Karenia_brevis.AAC.1